MTIWNKADLTKNFMSNNIENFRFNHFNYETVIQFEISEINTLSENEVSSKVIRLVAKYFQYCIRFGGYFNQKLNVCIL